MSSLDYLDLCRLCLVKDRVSVPIFEGEGDVRQIFLKIAACLPVKVAREDKLPKKICDDCVYKVELLYQFWNTTASAEKQLLQWLGDVNLDDKQGYVTGSHNQSLMKPGQNPVENRLDGSVMQQVNDHPNNMGMGMMDTMGMGMPMMITSSGQQQQSQQQQQMTSVPMDTGGNSVQNVQAVPGPSTQSTHEQIAQQKVINPSSNQDDDEDESEEDDNSDDECDGDDGLPVKEESEEDPNSSRTIEPTTFVNVSLACDEAGPSGLQQQKIGEMPEMVMPTADGDPKSGLQQGNLRNARKSRPSSGTTRLDGRDEFDDRVSEVVDCIINAEVKVCERNRRTEQHRCDSCDEYHDSEDALLLHRTEQEIRRVRRNIRERRLADFSCPYCGEKFTKNTSLLRHQRKRCREYREVIKLHRPFVQEAETDQVREDTLYLAGPIECDICHKKFKKKRYIRVHMRLHGSPSVCDICGAVLASAWCLEQHIRRHRADYSVFCEVCNKGFYYRATLNVHMTTHTKEKTIACEVCKRAFANRVYLRSHMRTHLDPETRKKFKCELCSFETFYSYCYKEHRDTHTGEGRIECQICGKFIRRQYMKTHVRMHTGEKPEICEFCGKRFLSRKYLTKHRRTHTGDRPYRCFMCDNSFTQRSSLMKHLKSCGRQKKCVEEEGDMKDIEKFNIQRC